MNESGVSQGIQGGCGGRNGGKGEQKITEIKHKHTRIR